MAYNEDDRDFLKGGLMKVTTIPGNLPNSAYSASIFTVYGASNAGVVKSSIGTIYSLVGTNQSAATARYIQLHNSATVVASGAVPLRSFQVAAAPGQTAIGDDILTSSGETYGLGVVYAWSTTPNSFTPATGSDHNLVLRLQ
jgi:hypothetical protein